jgi:RNA polymerase sigma factor (sigma-70 family)
MSDAGTVFLVDDDSAVLAALSRLLRSAGYRAMTFASAQDFIDGGHEQSVGCIVLDVSMPGLSGVELQDLLKERSSALPIVFLTGAGDINMGVRAMKVGAADFLTKPVDDAVLLESVGAAIERSRSESQARATTRDIRQRLETLTPREREVLPLIVAGRMNKQVAAELGTAEKTVKVHRARVMAKMKARTLPELVRLAEAAGVSLPSTPPG